MNTNVADRPLSLAAHLRRVSDLLESNLLFYRWTDTLNCNADLLIRAVTGWTEAELSRHRHEGTVPALWRNCINDALLCPHNPGIKKTQFYESLEHLGLSVSDLAHVEQLNNRTINGWWRYPSRDAKPSVVNYFRRWASLIEAYRANNPEATPGTEAAMDAAELRPLVEST